jgi:hypothetical protein
VPDSRASRAHPSHRTFSPPYTTGEVPDEDDLEDLTAMRDDAGFHTLQLITLLIAHVWSFEHAGMHNRVAMLLTQSDHQLGQVCTQPAHRATESGAGGLTKEEDTPLPSNSPHDHMILRVDLVGSHGRWKGPCLQTAHMTI